MAFDSTSSASSPSMARPPPGPPANRKNTLQQMLHLERKNKIDRMRASAHDVNPYRGTTYQSTTPCDPAVENYGSSRQSVSKVLPGTTTPAALSIKSSNSSVQTGKQKQQQQQQQQQDWPVTPGELRSIDSYLFKDFPSLKSQPPRTNSFSAFDPGLSVSLPAGEAAGYRNPPHENKYPGQKKILPQQAGPALPKAPLNQQLYTETFMPKDGRANSSHSFSILPSGMTMRRPAARNPAQGVPQLDGSSDSKPVRHDGTFEQNDENETSAVDRPQTPNLNRIESDRTSICRSPSWSLTNGERGRKLDEERRIRKKAAKEAKQLQDKREKEAKMLQDKREKEAKMLKEKKEKEAKTLRGKQEKEQKAMRDREEKEAKAALKKEKKLSKLPSTPRKLIKGDRSNSMSAVPIASRIMSGPRPFSAKSTEGPAHDEPLAPKSFQTPSQGLLSGYGFIGGLKLDNARKAVSGQSVDSGARVGGTAKLAIAVRRHEPDGDEEDSEKDVMRKAYNMTLADSPPSLSSSATLGDNSRRKTIAVGPPINVSQPQDLMELFGKPDCPVYQLPSQANNSFVDEIFHTRRRNTSQSSSLLPKSHPLRSHPSYEFRSTHRGSDESMGLDTRGSKHDGKHEESSYDSSSFASRMAKKSGSFASVSSKFQDHDFRPTYGDHISSQVSSDRLAAVLGAEVPDDSVQTGKRHQARVLESVGTKSRSMLLKESSVAGAEEEEREEVQDPSTAKVTRPSRDWFRKSVKEEPKLTIQERRRSRSILRESQAQQANSVHSSEKSESSQAESVASKVRNGRRNSISPTLNNFKAAAKAAYSKYGPAAPSSLANLPSSSLNVNRPGSADGSGSDTASSKDGRKMLPSSVTMSPLAKANKLLGANLSAITIIEPQPSIEHGSASKSSSVITKGSDEEVPSSPEDVEDTSNITTPTASRPTSKKEQLLTLKPPLSSTLVPGTRFRDEFSPGFLSALDRGKFELSPASNDGGASASSTRESSSTQSTPIASPNATDESSKPVSASELPSSSSKAEDDESLIADAIARVEKFTLSTGRKDNEESSDVDVVGSNRASGKVEQVTATSACILPSAQHNNENKTVPNKALGYLSRQPSVKSASTSHLQDLKNIALTGNNNKSNSHNVTGSKDNVTTTTGGTGPKKPAPVELDFSFLPPLKHESLTRPPRALASASASSALQAMASSLLGPASPKGAGSATSRSPFLLPSQHATSGAMPRDGASSRPFTAPAFSVDGVVTQPSVKESWLAAISADTRSRAAPPDNLATGPAVPPTDLVTSSVALLRTQTPSSFPSLSSLGGGAGTVSPAVPFQLSSQILKHPAGGALEDPYAKCFFVCCACKRFHDLPARVYEGLLRRGAGGVGVGSGEEAVRCQWCGHELMTRCCENWAVCVKLMERLG